MNKSFIFKICLVTMLFSISIFAQNIYTENEVEFERGWKYCIELKTGKPLSGIVKANGYGGERADLSFKNGKRDGWQHVYYDNGQIHFSRLINNDIEIEYKEFYPDGKISKTIPYNGIAREYFYNKEYLATSEVNYKNGMKEGIETKFIKNTLTDEIAMTSECNYKNGEKDGLCIKYDPGNDMVSSIYRYKDGKTKSWRFFTSDGPMLLNKYDDTGKIISSIRYKNGKRIKLTDEQIKLEELRTNK